MTAITFNTEPRAASRGRHTPEKRDACAIGTVAAASHLAMIKRFFRFILTIALLAGVAAGTVALKTAIWVPHFNH
jgi:hypothetical protein